MWREQDQAEAKQREPPLFTKRGYFSDRGSESRSQTEPIPLPFLLPHSAANDKEKELSAGYQGHTGSLSLAHTVLTQTCFLQIAAICTKPLLSTHYGQDQPVGVWKGASLMSGVRWRLDLFHYGYIIP